MYMCYTPLLDCLHSIPRLIKDGSDPETQAKFHSTVADAHLYLVNLIKAYIRR